MEGIPDYLPGEPGVDPQTGEYTEPAPEGGWVPDAPPGGLSTVPATPEQAEILMAPVDGDGEVDVLPQNGACYMPHVHIRNRLNRAFRPLGWGLAPLSGLQEDGTTMWREWSLWINGRFVSQAYGSMGRGGDNQDTNLADYNEGTKSNALQRMAKDIGVGAELWDKAWTNNWRETMAVRVWVDGKQKPQWRRLDASKFWNERTVTDDSPNREEYAALFAATGQPSAGAYAPAPQAPAQAPPRTRQQPPEEPPHPGQAPSPPPAQHAPQRPTQPAAPPAPTPAQATTIPAPGQTDAPDVPTEMVKSCRVLKSTPAYTVYGVTTDRRQYSFFKQDKKNPNFDGEKLYANCQWALANQAPIVTQFVQDGNYFNLLAIAKAPR